MPTTQPTISIPIIFNLPIHRLSDALVSAFEGGSNGWMDHIQTHVPYKTLTDDLASITDDGAPLFTIKYGEEEGNRRKKTLTLGELKKSLVSLAASKYARHLTDLINENDDAETADVILQGAMFEDIVYG
jgi:hypothetical protein